MAQRGEQRLLQTTLTDCIASPPNALPPSLRQDILAKYSLLTSYTHSVFDLLVTSPQLAKTVEAHKAALGVEKPAYKSREEQRALASAEAEAWKRTLSQSLVHPGKTVDLDREFIVGVLLRTKQACLTCYRCTIAPGLRLIYCPLRSQVPEVEAQEADLLKSVPPISDPAALYKQLKAHDSLVDSAMDACSRLRSGVEDREFNWKARILGDDEDDEEEEEEADREPKQEIKPPKYSTEALGRFMREGILAG